jgi:hypothetical protein
MGLGLVVAAAMVAAQAASASAAAPEFGHCVKAAIIHTGEYKGAHCVLLSPTHKGEYNWVPEPTGNTKFETQGEQVALATPGVTIICGAMAGEGEYTGPKTITEKGSFIGCHSPTQKCQNNPFKEGEIEYEGEGELGYITFGEKPIVGLDLKPKSPSTSLMNFECGLPPETNITTYTVEGSVIAPIKPNNKMTLEFKLPYKESGGIQAVESFEGGAKDTLTAKLVSGIETKEEPFGIRQNEVQENGEPVEMKAL